MTPPVFQVPEHRLGQVYREGLRLSRGTNQAKAASIEDPAHFELLFDDESPFC